MGHINMILKYPACNSEISNLVYPANNTSSAQHIIDNKNSLDAFRIE